MCDCTAFWSLITLSKVNDTGIPTPTVVPLSGVYVPMKLLPEVTVVKMELAAAVLPLESFAVADIWYLVPRSNCSFGFQLAPSADIAPSTACPDPETVIFTSVSLPSLTRTPVALMDAFVEPSFAEMTIFAVDVFTDVPPPPLLLVSASALAFPPHALRVRVPTTRAAMAPSTRRAAMSGVVTGCSRFVGCADCGVRCAQWSRVVRGA